MKSVKVSFVIPCLNEEKAIGKVVSSINYLVSRNKKYKSEIIVVDNGSTDRSREVAKKAGAKVIFEPKKGYGRALRTGLERASGEYLIFADGDGSYDFSETPKLLSKLQEKDLVIGSRLKGKIKKEAMPFLHRYIGTPVLNFLFSLFFKQKISDVNSGFRGLTKKAFEKLKLKATGMEFASEMIYKASKMNLRIAEVPITYRRRIGKSKLTPFRDAWRHVKFLLLFSPSFLFLIPGILLIVIGFFLLFWLLPGKQYLFGKYFDTHTMITAAFLVLTGFQIVFLGLFAKVFALNFLEGGQDLTTQKLVRKFSLEQGILAGLISFFLGLGGFLYVVYLWWQTQFSVLDAERLLIFSLTFLVLGLQIIFSSFFFGIIGKEER